MEDKYLQPRRKVPAHEVKMHLLEVDNCCPLCGRLLQSSKQRKKGAKLYEIAHIYPNSPTAKQLSELKDVERLGNDSESFENKIALCLNCHKQQDYHTKRDEYERLLSKKKECLIRTSLREITDDYNLEKEIYSVIEKICQQSFNDRAQLNYKVVPIANKFKSDEFLIKERISRFISLYYRMIKEEFQSIDENSNFSFEALCFQIKALFIQLDKICTSKEQIFDSMVDWLFRLTNSKNRTACEIVISFFVQNCEVFYEITE